MATSAQESQLVQSMLAEVGADVQIETVDVDQFFENYILIGDYDMTVFSWIGTPFPISSSQSIYANPQGDEIQQNFARVGSQEIDDLFAEVVQILDPEEAREVANEIDALIWDEVHSLTLYQRPDIIAAKDTLANYGALRASPRRGTRTSVSPSDLSCVSTTSSGGSADGPASRCVFRCEICASGRRIRLLMAHHCRRSRAGGREDLLRDSLPPPAARPRPPRRRDDQQRGDDGPVRRRGRAGHPAHLHAG